MVEREPDATGGPFAATETTAAQRRIIRAAEEAFKKSGFRGVTMEAVARDAAVAKATLYAQFRNKDELFLAVCSRMAALTNRAFTEALNDPHGRWTSGWPGRSSPSTG
jgi:AcrR family transcriptional regulator